MLQVFMVQSENLPAVSFFDGWFVVSREKLHSLITRHIERHLLIQADLILEETTGDPEMSRRRRVMHLPRRAVFQYVPDRQCLYR